jgi:HlyD family secretion protein
MGGPGVPRRRGRRLAAIVVGALVLVAGAVGVSQALAARPTLRTATVTRGDIHSTVDTNGRLEALTTARLGFKTGGRLTVLHVKEGDTVAAGALLAEQDTASLDRTRQQAATELEIARLKLQQAHDGPRPEDLAAAQADLQSALTALRQLQAGGQTTDIRAAQAALDQAIARRDDLKRGSTAAQISTAQATLREAQAQLDKVKKGASSDDIAAAQADVQQAQAQLDKVKKGATAEEIAGAQAAVRQAQAGLDKAKAPARPEDIAGAQAAVRQAQANLDKLKAGATQTDLAAAQARVDSATANRAQVSATLSNAKEQARISLDLAANKVRDAQQLYSDIASANQRAYRDRGQEVPSDAQAREDAAWRDVQNAMGAMQQAILAYEAAKQNEIAGLTQADKAIQEAQAALDKLRAGATAQDLAAAQAAVDQAQSSLNRLQNGAAASDVAAAQAAVDQAQAKLDQLKAGPTAQDLAAAQAVVDQAQAKLRKIQAGPTAEDLAAAQASVDKAQAALTEAKAGPRPDALREADAAVAQAQANLDKVKKGGTGADVAAAQARVAAAQAAVDLKKQGPTATEIRILEQQVQLAQYALDSATAAVADARLTAPFAGTVLTVDAKEGELVGTTPVLELAELGTLRARADIDELDVGRVRPGQPVTLTLDAYPGDKLPGVVESIAPGATQQSGSTVYKATVVFTPTVSVQARLGMAASLLITSQSKTNVLLVPNRSLENIGGQQFVTLVEGDTQRKQHVEPGLANADSTEIVDDGSLKAGQVVVVR